MVIHQIGGRYYHFPDWLSRIYRRIFGGYILKIYNPSEETKRIVGL